MEVDRLEDALLEVARRAGVRVRKESFDPRVFGQAGQRGGLCVLGGESVILLDSSLSCVERVAVISDALAGFDLESISMPPAARERIERSARKRAHAARARRPQLRRVI